MIEMLRCSFGCLAICCLFAAVCVTVVSADDDGLEKPTCAQYFYKEKDCPNCTKFSKILDEVVEEYSPNLTVLRYAIDNDDYNTSLMNAFYDYHSYKKERVVPVLFVGKGIIVGNEWDTDYHARISAVVETQAGAECPDPDSVLYPDLHISFALTLVLAFFASLATVSIHPGILVVFARLLRSLGFGELYSSASTATELESVPEIEVSSGGDAPNGKEEEAKEDEGKGGVEESPRKIEEADTSSAVLSTESDTKAGEDDAGSVEKDKATPAAGSTDKKANKPDGVSRFLSVGVYFLMYMLPTFLVGIIFVAIVIAIIDRQTLMSMFVVDKIACALFFLVCVLFALDVLGYKCCHVHMSVPLCYGAKLTQLANSTRSVKGAMYTGLLAFVVLLPLTAASQLACYFLIAARSEETSVGFWAVFVALLGHMLPCIVLYVIVCFKPAVLDTFWRRLPKWSPLLSLIIALSAGLFAFCFVLEGLVFNPL